MHVIDRVCPDPITAMRYFANLSCGGSVKFGVVEAPLHSRFGAMMVPETGYRTAG